MTRILRLMPPVAYMAGIYLLSSIPGREAPETVAEQLLHWVEPQWQNLLHVPLYGGLALLWLRALESWIPDRRTRAVLAFLLTACWGLLDEWHQLHVPGRFASWTDVVMNGAGAWLALWLPGLHRPGKAAERG